MDYELLKRAPDNHMSPAFIKFLSDNNPVVYEDGNWLVVENCKYHKKDSPWLTAFYKGPLHEPWHTNLKPLYEIFGDWEWLKKAAKKQTVRRPHIHLIKHL